MKALSLGLPGQQKVKAAGIEEKMANVLMHLEGIGNQANASLLDLGVTGSNARDALDRSCRLLLAHPEFVETLAECGAAINAVVSASGEGAPENLDGIRQKVLDLLHTRYTMASERKVHEMFGGADSRPATTEEVSVDDLLF